MINRIFRATEQDPFQEINQHIEQARQAFAEAPFSPAKKQVVDAALDCLQNKLASGAYAQLSFLISAEQKMKFTAQLIDCAYEHDDTFLRQVRELCFTLPENSQLRKVTMDAVTAARQELTARRETMHQYALIGTVAMTALAFWKSPPLGIVMLVTELVACVNIDFKSVQNSLLEMYDSTAFMTVKKGNVETRELKTTYDAASRRPGR